MQQKYYIVDVKIASKEGHRLNLPLKVKEGEKIDLTPLTKQGITILGMHYYPPSFEEDSNTQE